MQYFLENETAGRLQEVTMEQSFWQKLQRVKAKDIGNIFVFILALPVAAVYKRKRKDLWLIWTLCMQSIRNRRIMHG